MQFIYRIRSCNTHRRKVFRKEYLLPLSIELFTSNELDNLVCEVSETRHGEHNI